jgi:uncharacterized Zn-binding protein involved in type VI secretion
LNQKTLGFVNRRSALVFPKTPSHPFEKPIMFVFGLGDGKMSERSYDPKRARRGWVALLTIVVLGLAAILPRPASSGSKDDTTGTVSKAEPPVTQDGTPAHPYADASQCPSNTDLIIWPSGRSVPSLPPGISVCFVGDRSFNDGDSGVQVRQR